MIQNTTTTHKNILSILMHIGFWFLVFLWPLLSLDDIPSSQYIINRNWLSTSSILIVFYLNYFLFVDFYFFKKNKTTFYIINLGLVIATFFLIKYFLKLDLFNPMINGMRMREVRTGAISSVQLILPMILSIGMCTGLKMNTKWNKNQLILQQVQQTQLNAEIKYLRYQIQPHFLFNTLNNIYALIDSAPFIAKTSIHSLSKMMRYILHDTATNKVPLVKEIDFLERYIDLMQLRVSSNIKLEKKFPVINQPIQIAPLLLISFIENAFKHGIDAVQPSYIKIELTIADDLLHYTVINSSFPQKEKTTDSGIGLENLKKRLELVYPDKFELLTEAKNTLYIAKLTLNYK